MAHDFELDETDPSAPARDALILYATETGTAEDAARRLARRLRARAFHVRVVSADAYPPEDLITESLVLFVVSTTGAGKEPRALAALWASLLRAGLPSDLFEDVQYVVFGLGDTAYERFCWPAKLLDRRLAALGAVPVCARGEGDEQHRLGIDGALLPWMRTLEASLDELYPPPAPLPPAIDPNEPYAPRVVLVPSNRPVDAPAGPWAEVRTNARMTADEWAQDVRHVVLALDDSVSYEPGDVAAIYPEADPDAVDAFLDACGWAADADTPFDLHPAPGETLPPRVPKTSTLRTLLTHHLDISAVPRRAFFELIRHFASDQQEAEKLAEFASEDGPGAEDMWEYVTRPRRTIAEVLGDFHSVRIPRDHVCDALPALRPRLFSLASAARAHPGEAHLCVAIVRFRTLMRRARTGVCTAYLARLQPGNRVAVEIQKGTLRLPPDAATPVLCVGPGTGVAPMRALLEERIAAGARDNTLYFGCRSAGTDEHFAADWAAMAAAGQLRYRLAASRDGGEGVARTYVQHLLAEDGERVAHALVKKEGWVYLSGSAGKMPAAVRDAVYGALVAHAGMDDDGARAYVRRMEAEGRWWEECWS